MIKNLKYLEKREWFMIFTSFLFIIIQVRLDLAVPEYMSEITRLVQTEGTQISEIVMNGGYMLGASLLSVMSSVFVGYLASRIGAGLGKGLRQTLFDKVQSFSMEEINQFSTASLITRTTGDVQAVQRFIAMGLQVIVKAPILAFFAIRKVTGTSWQWSALIGGVVIFLLIVIVFVTFVAMPKFKRVQELTDNINLVTRENLTGLEVVRAYNAESYQEDKFGVASEELAKNNLFGTRAMATLPSSLQFSMSAISLGVYWLGAIIISGAQMGDRLGLFSNMVVFSSYALQIIGAFMMLSMLFLLYPRASVSAKRVNEVLDTEPTIIDGKEDGKNTDTNGKIEIKNVSFTYPDAEEHVLKDINFTVNPGETVAFIGSTGSGKSTLINLIPRFYDVTEGEILIDGLNVKDYKLEDLYNKIGYVPQKSVLFGGTIKSNINFGDRKIGEMTDDEIRQALEISQGMDFVSKLDGEIEGHVSQEGTNLSGGQKQRVSIARAIARKPEIFIFDDSFSALDFKTDREVRTELNKHTQGVTKLIVAQRIGTIRDADQIVVLDNGNMVGLGTHDELMKDCTVYQEIAKSQLTEEELKSA